MEAPEVVPAGKSTSPIAECGPGRSPAGGGGGDGVLGDAGAGAGVSIVTVTVAEGGGGVPQEVRDAATATAMIFRIGMTSPLRHQHFCHTNRGQARPFA
jgi:hypothetical protein